jgi:hypothetical protein
MEMTEYGPETSCWVELAADDHACGRAAVHDPQIVAFAITVPDPSPAQP